MGTLSRSLKLGVSALGLAVASSTMDAAWAQEVAPETVVVTGTSIRGASPVGSSLITLDATSIAETANTTVDQIVKDIPAISNSGSNPQGTQAGNSNFSPTVHDLGSSSSNSTLILVDGHRISNDAQQQPLYDPGMIPSSMIQRVEVLTDGASSVYGSDAVAGVINFVTRTRYEGLQLSAQTGSGNHYSTYGATMLWGASWEKDSLIFGATWTQLGGIPYDPNTRLFLNPNHTAQAAAAGLATGSTNFLTFNCDPATIQPNGTGNIYRSATATTSVANTNANSPCNSTQNGNLVSPDRRTNGMVKFSHQVTDALTMNVDAVYSYHTVDGPTAEGTVTATVYGAGPQANPFYINPPGVTATKQVVRWDAHALLGPDYHPKSYNETEGYYLDVHPEWKISDDFRLTGMLIYAGDNNYVGSTGTLCASCAFQGLNGTTNTNGSTTTPSIINTSIIATTLPLTTANALDVWNPAATNRTSAAERQRLTDNQQTSRWFYTTQDAKIGLDGTAFHLPAGPVNVAVGAEYTRYALRIEKTSSNNTGPASTSEQFLGLRLSRAVTAAYGEILLPLVSPEMNIPLAQKISLDISGRYDHYDDVGDTANPKYGLDWVVLDGLKLRAAWASSFVAPELSSIGDRTKTGPNGLGGGFTTFTGYSTASSSFTVPQASFPLAAQVPGVTCTNGTCSINGGSVQGISFNGGPNNPKPSRGRSWSVGADISPSLIPGFNASISLFNTTYINGITGASLSNAIISPSLNLLTFYPAGATQAQIQAVTGPYAVVNSFPSVIYYIDSVQQNNILNLNVEGLDLSWLYQFDVGDWGSFNTGGSWTQFLLFNQHVKGGPTFSVLGTTGANNTFPSIAGQGRIYVGWDYQGFSTKLTGRFISGYRNWSASTLTPVGTAANGTPFGGGDIVKSHLTFDFHASYSFSQSDLMGVNLQGSQIFVDVVNLFRQAPEYYNGASGYDQYSGNPIGRVITVGVRSSF